MYNYLLILSIFLIKMDQLFKKLEGKLEVKWNDALESLSACDLDVEAAFYDVQCKSLKGLYDYMTTDYSHIIQGGEKTEGELKTENDYLKEVVMERMAKEDDEALFNVSDPIANLGGLLL